MPCPTRNTLALELPRDIALDPRVLELLNERLRQIERNLGLPDGDLDMCGFRIKNLGDARDPFDAISLSFGDRRYLHIHKPGEGGGTVVTTTVEQGDKVTFGIGTAVVADNVTRKWYDVFLPGTFYEINVKATEPPTTADLILDVRKSTDDGATTVSVLPASAKLVVPVGSGATHRFTAFAAAPDSDVAVKNKLRCDCLQAGGAKNIQVTGRWR